MGIIFFFFYFGNLANHMISAFAMKKSPLACPGRPRALKGGYGKIIAVLSNRFCYQKLRAGCLALLQAATTLGGPPWRYFSKNSFEKPISKSENKTKKRRH